MLSNTKKNSVDKKSNPYELINEKNAVKPNYNLKEKPFSFEIYMNYLGDLCIIGRIDGNYICGLSFSTVKDLERTQAIIEGMIGNIDPLISNTYRVLGGFDASEWCQIRMEHATLEGEVWLSIFGCMSRKLSARFQISYTAKQLQSVYSILSDTCKFRLADGKYIPVLKQYHKLLTTFKRGHSKAPEYYHQMIPLIDLVQKEGYIVLSSDSAVRELYAAILAGANDLYGAFMDAAR